jgi:hypothetical protein
MCTQPQGPTFSHHNCPSVEVPLHGIHGALKDDARGRGSGGPQGGGTRWPAQAEKGAGAVPPHPPPDPPLGRPAACHATLMALRHAARRCQEHSLWRRHQVGGCMLQHIPEVYGVDSGQLRSPRKLPDLFHDLLWCLGDAGYCDSPRTCIPRQI